MKFKYLLQVVILLLLGVNLSAQSSEAEDSKSVVIINHADRQVIDASQDTLIQYLFGDVQAYHDSAFLFCDTAVLVGRNLDALGNVIILQSDTIRIFADSLFYVGDSLKAYLKGNVILENGDKKIYTSQMTYLTDKKIAYYDQKAILESKGSELRSQRGYYDINSKNAYFYGNVTAKNPDFFLKSDSLIYNTDIEKTTFIAPTIINQGEAKIYCESGYYDIDDKLAIFSSNAQYQKNDENTTADTISYDGNIDVINLKGNAKYKSKDERAEADIINYDQKNDIIKLSGNGFFTTKSNTVRGERITYDKKKERFITKGRSSVSDKATILTAEDIDFDKLSGNGIAIGNVIFEDTINRSNIYCDTLIIFKNDTFESTKSIGALFRPEIITIDDENDTLHITADTLFSIKKILQRDSLTNDTLQYMVGDNDVRIFKSDFQAVADSLIYNDRDSIFNLFKNPVVWADSTQIFGDTIRMYLKNKKIDQMHFIQKAMIINTSDMIYFTQIQGKNIFADFIDNKINKMKVQGNARSLYYMQDEAKAYVGVNKTDCSLIIFNFMDNEIKNIKFYINPVSKALPMLNTDHNSLRLDGFKWYGERRPVLLNLREFKTSMEVEVFEENLETIEDIEQGKGIESSSESIELKK